MEGIPREAYHGLCHRSVKKTLKPNFLILWMSHQCPKVWSLSADSQQTDINATAATAPNKAIS